jgi:hypothetical protein
VRHNNKFADTVSRSHSNLSSDALSIGAFLDFLQPYTELGLFMKTTATGSNWPKLLSSSAGLGNFLLYGQKGIFIGWNSRRPKAFFYSSPFFYLNGKRQAAVWRRRKPP